MGDNGSRFVKKAVKLLEGGAMDTKFSGFEILKIAEKVSHNGAEFYRKEAELFDNPEVLQVLSALVGWHEKHEKIFARMRRRFSEKTGNFGVFDPDDYIRSNPEAMAALTPFAIKSDAARQFSGSESKEQILEEAIRKKKDIIVFYNGLKDFARDQVGRDIIDEIIKEENRHIEMLSKSVKQE